MRCNVMRTAEIWDSIERERLHLRANLGPAPSSFAVRILPCLYLVARPNLFSLLSTYRHLRHIVAQLLIPISLYITEISHGLCHSIQQSVCAQSLALCAKPLDERQVSKRHLERQREHTAFFIAFHSYKCSEKSEIVQMSRCPGSVEWILRANSDSFLILNNPGCKSALLLVEESGLFKITLDFRWKLWCVHVETRADRNRLALWTWTARVRESRYLVKN